MQSETSAPAGNESGSSGFSLLQYEINRAKSHLRACGESAAVQKRLEQLEHLMQAGAAQQGG